MEGVRGVYIATLINGSFSEENMRSVITFDKGGTWELLQPPAQTHYGEHIDCQVPRGGGTLRKPHGWHLGMCVGVGDLRSFHSTNGVPPCLPKQKGILPCPGRMRGGC